MFNRHNGTGRHVRFWGWQTGHGGRGARSRPRRPVLDGVGRFDVLEARLMLSAVRNLSGFAAHSVGANDDGSFGPFPLGFNANFFGVTRSSAFVNNNGNITLDSNLGTYTPFDLTSTSQQIIAPFFADVDTRGSGSGIVTYGTDQVDGHPAFGVDYINVGYYSGHTDKKNSFQVVLIDRSDTGTGNFDIELNYDKVQWETGDASGGSGGLGGSPARAGFSNGTRNPGTFFELPGSAVHLAYLDSNLSSGLIHNSIGSSELGRYVFSARSGSVKQAVAFDSLSAPTITYGTAATTTLSGHISSGTAIPPGQVDITFNNTVQHAAIDPTTGNFAATFTTAALGVAGSPYTIVYSYAGDSTYATLNAATSLTVNKANPTLTWANPAGITYGTPLGAAQLNAVVTVPGPDPTIGAVTYTPPAGTYLNAGAAQTLTVNVGATANYNAASKSVTIDVAKANPTINWATPADLLAGTPLDASTLNATITVPGPDPASPLVYNPTVGTILPVGPGQTLSVSAAATSNYNAASASVTVNVVTSPNLQVASVVAPPSAFSSQQTVVQWTVTNVGTGATSAPSWSDGVWLSLDTTFDATDVFLGSAANPSYLDVGDSYVSQLAVTLPRGISGNYYFLVKADVNNQVNEFENEGDNLNFGGPTNVHLTPPPDLQPTSVSGPLQAFSGQPATVRWTVANTGSGATPETAWYDTVYLSSDTTLDASDRLLATRLHSGSLNVGQSYQAVQSVNLPTGISGDYYFIVVTDSQNQVYEHSNEANNLKASTATTHINLTPPPDLNVSTVSAPSTALAGHPVTFSYHVTNVGATATPNASWSDSFYLSAAPTFNAATDIFLGDRIHFGALDIDESYDGSATFTLPNGLSGVYYAFVVTDRANAVFELDKSNNVAPSSKTIAIDSRPADLTVSSFASPTGGEAGKSLLIGWAVTNLGTGDTAVAGWTDRVYLTPAASPDNPLLLGSFPHSGLLDVGQSYSNLTGATGTALLQLPFTLSAGLYFLSVVTDADGQVYEGGNEGNNRSTYRSLSITRQTPDLHITRVDSPASVAAGSPLDVSWTVQNAGSNVTNSNYWYDDVYLSTDDVISPDDVKLGSYRRSNVLDPGGQYDASATFTVPLSLRGVYNVIVRTDSTGLVLEDPLEGNNDRPAPVALTVGPPDRTVNPVPDLVLAGVDAPATGFTGQPFTVTWMVRNDGDPTGNKSWYDAFYLSRDQVFDRSTDVYLGFRTRSGNLGTGALYTETQSFTIPTGLSGPFWVFAVTDGGNSLSEGNETNNVAYDASPMQVSLVPPADLTGGTITVPADGSPGRNATIQYTVHNQGNSPALGTWSDSIYLSADATWDIDDAFFGRVTHVGDVAGGASYTETLTAPLPGLVAGNYHVIIRTDIRNNIPEVDEHNNIGASLDRVDIDADRLTLGVPSSGTLGQGQSVYYRIDVGAGQTLKVALDSQSSTAANELYIRYGAIPSRTQFDVGYSTPLSADQQVIVPSTQGGTYYVLAYGDSLSGGPAAFSIKASVLVFSIESVGPSHGSNRGDVTVSVTGSKFEDDGTISLVGGDGVRHTATQTWWKDRTEIWATFDLRGLSTGQYAVRVDQSGQSTTAASAFTVNAGPVGALNVWVDSPDTLRPGQPGVVTVSYSNSGETDVPAPVLNLDATNALLKLADGSTAAGVNFLGIDDQGPAGILSPGARGSFSYVFQPTATSGSVNFTVGQVLDDQAIDWNRLKESTLPGTISDAAWDVILRNFTAEVGATGAQYRAVLDDDANYLSQLGIYTSDTARLLRFELQQADQSLWRAALVGPSSLGNSLDVLASSSQGSASGLPLFFSRTYDGTIEGHFRLGPLGRGWTGSWEIGASVDSDGNVTVREAGNARVFLRQADGSYKGLTGDPARLTLVDNTYRLDDQGGSVTTFRSDGRLDSVVDRNGNRITAGYTGTRLTSLVHSDGESITIAYNAAGRISQVTDNSGRAVMYQYDASGESLTAVTAPGGTTRYTYETTPGSESEHALTSITYPDGTHAYFTYDVRGRLVRHNVDGGAELIAYTYDSAGGVTFTDASGHSSRLLLNDMGASGRVTDQLGRVTQFRYDDAGRLTQMTGPDDSISSYGYDSRGNLSSFRDPLGQELTFTYNPTFDQLLSVRDARGNVTRYSYDQQGNLLGITYPDGHSENLSYDAEGNLVVGVNRRNQTVQYTYNSLGLVTRKQFPDGTAAELTYDARGNLLTAVDSNSSVSFSYDSSDRLTRVSYGPGRFVEYTYDSSNRRTRMVDGSGFAVNYAYDAQGRLERLTDGAGATIVQYTYDDRGRVTREDNGNHTFSTFTYDAAGQLTHLVNYAADGTTVNSRFDYTYDAAGNRTSVTTLQGTTTFGYDFTGQLTSVTLPDGRAIEYRYDAAGNRIAVTDNGVQTSYTSNNLDQYVTVGDTTYGYDADGNLVSKIRGTDTWTYGYDSENRLIRAVTPDGVVWQYEYDALGNRIASIRNGQRTDFLIDLIGWGDVVAEYGLDGNLSAHYTNGIGLVSRVDASNVAAYYDYDALGSTVGMSGADGSYVNRYSYLPFGENLAKTETIPNTFEYAGRWEVSSEGNGLDYMRARYYDPSTAKFNSIDPLGVNATDTNLYRYVKNDPLAYNDPTGRFVFIPILVGAGVGALTDIGVQLIFNGGNFNDINWGSVAVSAGLGALGGGLGGGLLKEAGWEWSHWIPGRFSNPASQFYKGLPRWVTENSLNGNFVPRWFHAATDPYRLLKGMTKWGNHLYPPLVRQFLRLPLWLTGGGLFGPLGGALTRLIRPSDPNDIVGPGGFGSEHWVTAGRNYPYTIRFENRATASAPARQVVITQTLDPDLDPRTFRVGDFGWGDILIDVPDNRSFYSVLLDFSDRLGFAVDVSAGIDVATGVAFWTLTTIDPQTGEIPTDASVGFLPPNDAAHVGEGFVSYTVRPRSAAVTGTRIDAQARIVFDTEEPIDTPAIFNTIDAVAPTSRVAALPATTAQSTFTVHWSGADDDGGSALASYTILVSDNGAPFVPWLVDNTGTEADYVGTSGHSYAFYSFAHDNAENVESAPATADAQIFVLSSDTAPPDAPTGLHISPDTGHLSDDGVTTTGAISLLGSLGEIGLHVLVADITTGTDLGAATVNGTGFSKDLSLAEGSHQLRVRAVDAAGNTSADAFFTVVVDLTRPSETTLNPVSPNPRNTAVSSLRVTFSEPVDVSTFDPSDIDLYRNGVLLPAVPGLALVPVSGNTYDITGLGDLNGPTGPDGSYQLTLKPAGISDVAGNAGTNASPTATWLMDRTPPTSRVNYLASSQTTKTFNVSATGSDPAPSGGASSGIVGYDLYARDYSVPNSTYVLFATVPANNPITQFTGQSNHSYGFHSIARDAVGNTEAPKGDTVAEATTNLPDLDAPVTSILPPSAGDVATPTLTLHFQGTDAGNSDLQYFDLFAKVDNAATYTKFLRVAAGSPSGGTYSGTAVYQANADGNSHSYAFYSVGIDSANNVELVPTTPDVVITKNFPAPATLAVSNLTIQNGLTERSYIRYIDVTFNMNDQTLDDLVSTPNRISLIRHNLDGSGGQAIDLTGRVSHRLAAFDHVIEFDFGQYGLGGVARGVSSLNQYWANMIAGDGYYEIALDLDNDASHTPDKVLHFYRLLGDVNGAVDPQHAVDATDLALIAMAPDSNADVNGDGVINATDTGLAQRSKAQNRKLTAGLVLDA